MAEAASLGMPFEVWKTRMGRFRNETTIESFKNVYKHGGGVSAFWKGLTPKLVESATKGAVLLFSKEAIENVLHSQGVSPTVASFASGAGGGIAQVSVMGPCTFLVTASVTAKDQKNFSILNTTKETLSKKGLAGFYPGGSAIAFRQATNWASRVGFTQLVRDQMKQWKYGNTKVQLSNREEALCGVIGGALSCWNHPFEVARIEMQARASLGESKMSMMQVFGQVYKEHGVPGLFKGVVPRIFLGVWQTLFMVSFAKIIKDSMK